MKIRVMNRIKILRQLMKVVIDTKAAPQVLIIFAVQHILILNRVNIYLYI